MLNCKATISFSFTLPILHHFRYVANLRPFCPPRVPLGGALGLGFGPWGRLPLRWVGGFWLGSRSSVASLPNCCAAASTNATSAAKASNLIRVRTGDLRLLGLGSSVSFSITSTLGSAAAMTFLSLRPPSKLPSSCSRKPCSLLWKLLNWLTNSKAPGSFSTKAVASVAMSILVAWPFS